MTRAVTLALLLAAWTLPASADVIPAELVGEWATAVAQFDERGGLTNGAALYLFADGTAAFIVAPPPVGVTGTATYDAATRTLSVTLTDRGHPMETVHALYDPATKTLRDPAAGGGGFRRRRERVPDAVARMLPAAAPPLFVADSKHLAQGQGPPAMDIVVSEVERLPMASVLEVDIKRRGSSVGASFFVLCSIRQLAYERGGYRHVVVLDERPKPGQVLVGFLASAGDDPRALGPAFQGEPPPKPVDLEESAAICEQMK